MSRVTVPNVVELFDDYGWSRARWNDEGRRFGRGWNALAPFFSADGATSDTELRRIVAAARADGDEKAERLARILLRMSERQRRRLPSALDEMKVSPRTRALYEHLRGQLFQVVVDRDVFDALYHEDQLENNECFARRVPAFQGYLYTLIPLRLMIGISRLLDPPESAYRKTATLEQLALATRDDGYRRLGAWMLRRLGRRGKYRKGRRKLPTTGIRKLAQPISTRRNRLDAHSDLEVALGNETVFGVKLGLVRRVIAEMAQLLDEFSIRVDRIAQNHAVLANADGAARQLLRVLDDRGV